MEKKIKENIKIKGNDYDTLITKDEIQETISSLKNSTMGPNAGPHTQHDAQENELPQQWKSSIICPIPIPRKNPSDPESYRPIALTSCLCKLAEKSYTKDSCGTLKLTTCYPRFICSIKIFFLFFRLLVYL